MENQCACVGKCTCVKPFKLSNHKWGVALAIVFTAFFIMLEVAYKMMRSPYEAQLAAKQVEDSSLTWNLYHNIAHNNAIVWGTAAVFLVIIGLCLAPAIKDALTSK